MSEQPQIRFTDGAGYEQMMGVWSRSVGQIFLDWLGPAKGLAWADIGCGNGAFTELIVDRCAPKSIVGIDPSPEQLKYARERHKAGVAQFIEAGAMALPIADASVDAAAMALVIFFVPEPIVGVREMMRVVRPGGSVSAYAWDFPGGGFPWDVIQNAVRAAGIEVPLPPSAAVSDLKALHQVWVDAGLKSVASRDITVERVFPGFDEYWRIGLLTPTLVKLMDATPPATIAQIKERVRAAVRIEDGKVIHTGRASAAKGIVP